MTRMEYLKDVKDELDRDLKEAKTINDKMLLVSLSQLKVSKVICLQNEEILKKLEDVRVAAGPY